MGLRQLLLFFIFSAPGPSLDVKILRQILTFKDGPAPKGLTAD